MSAGGCILCRFVWNRTPARHRSRCAPTPTNLASSHQLSLGSETVVCRLFAPLQCRVARRRLRWRGDKRMTGSNTLCLRGLQVCTNRPKTISKPGGMRITSQAPISTIAASRRQASACRMPRARPWAGSKRGPTTLSLARPAQRRSKAIQRYCRAWRTPRTTSWKSPAKLRPSVRRPVHSCA